MNERIYTMSRLAGARARELVPNLRDVIEYEQARDQVLVELVVRACAEQVQTYGMMRVAPAMQSGLLIRSWGLE
jgi:hypothetical protein